MGVESVCALCVIGWLLLATTACIRVLPPTVDARYAITGAPSLCGPLHSRFVLRSPLKHGQHGPNACAARSARGKISSLFRLWFWVDPQGWSHHAPRQATSAGRRCHHWLDGICRKLKERQGRELCVRFLPTSVGFPSCNHTAARGCLEQGKNSSHPRSAGAAHGTCFGSSILRLATKTPRFPGALVTPVRVLSEALRLTLSRRLFFTSCRLWRLGRQACGLCIFSKQSGPLREVSCWVCSRRWSL